LTQQTKNNLNLIIKSQKTEKESFFRRFL